MMLNRYQGNSGRVVRIEDGSHSAAPARRSPPPVAGPGARGAPAAPQSKYRGAAADKGLFGSLGEKLSGILPGSMGGLETEDLILLLILYLMYRESGDSELLIIMGAMFLL